MVQYQTVPFDQTEKDFFNSLTPDKLNNFEMVIFLGNPRTVTSKKTNESFNIYTGKLKYKGHEICDINFFENYSKKNGIRYLSGKGIDAYVASIKQKPTTYSTYNKNNTPSQESSQNQNPGAASEKDINFEDIPF